VIFTQWTRLRQSTLARNAGWMFAGQGLSFAIQGLYFFCLARLLGSLQYGILAGAAAFVMMANQYSTMGSGFLLLRYVSSDHSRFREYWGNVLLSTAIFGSGLVCLLLIVGRKTIGDESAALLLMLAISDCICGQITVAASQVFQAFEQMRITATLNLITNGFRLVLASAMLFYARWASARQWAIASLVVSILAVSLALITVTRRFGWPVFRPRLLLLRLKEGFVFAISGSTTSVYNDIDKVMLSHFGMNAANGIYSMAYRVVNIAAMPIMSVQAASFPRLFRDGVNGITATERFARKILKRTVVIALIGSLSMFVFAPLTPIFLGAGFIQSVSALRWLCLIPLFRCLHVTAGDAMAGAGYQDYRFASQFLAAISNFILNLFLIPRYSWFGAALASLATDGCLAVMSWTVLHWLRAREVRQNTHSERTAVSLEQTP
jgi:O-antigen/teichoic acid export membrane protein